MKEKRMSQHDLNSEGKREETDINTRKAGKTNSS